MDRYFSRHFFPLTRPFRYSAVMSGTQSQSGAQPVRLVYCYAPSDELQVRELDKHLDVLQAQGLIEVLDPSALLPGADWMAETARQIDRADIILFFVSADSLASMLAAHGQRALARHARGEAHLLPVLVRPALWQESPLAPLVPLPRDGRAVTVWPRRDQAWLEVAEGIR